MTDLPRLNVSRRAVLQGSAWAVPVIAAAIAAPAQTTSPPTGPAAAATPDWYQNNRALTIQSTEPGTPLAAGSYVFTTTGGVVPSLAVFRTVPALDANTVAATGQQTTATVTLAQGSALLSFTVYILTSALPAGTDPTATLTVTLPTGGGATVTILEQPPVVPPAVVFGPNGGHWPSNTPALSDAFVYDVEVDPTWTAISAAIAAAPASGNARVRVRPGTLPVGSGNGSTSRPALAAGFASRSSKVLVVPRDGWGTVVGNPASTFASGYSFTLSNVALLGFDFSAQGVVLRSCSNAAIGWSTFGILNVTANAVDVSGLELVECVLPDQAAYEGDRMALRLANGYSIAGMTMSGCYVAPSYRAAASTVHTDTLQISRTGTGRVRGLTMIDSAFFQSSSQALQFEFTDAVTIRHTALIGGLRGTGRYPLAADRYRMTGENALWGGSAAQPDSANDVTLADSVILGSISNFWKFTSISNTVTSKPLSGGTSVAQGAVTVDTQFASQSTPVPTAWFDANCPMPSSARLEQIWSALG